MKVLVLGMAKSGTTAVYTAIRNALGEDTDYLYEPSRLEEFDLVRNSTRPNVLVKAFFSVVRRTSLDLSIFDKVVLLCRDPRDVAISFVLFNFLMNCRSAECVPEIRDLLRAKEDDPRAVSMRQITERAGALCTRKPEWQRFSGLLAYSVELTRSHPKYHVARYEDFVDGRIEGLSAYLGLPISPQVQVADWVKQVERSKGYGDWKNWFTEEDIPYFQPLFQPYLEYFSYETEWTLAAQPVVRRELASGYIEKNLKEVAANPLVRGHHAAEGGGWLGRVLHKLRGGEATARSAPGGAAAVYSEAEIAKLRTAAADGKPVALRRLAMAYKSGNGVPQDRGEAIALLRRASEHKDLPAMVELASLRLQDGGEEAAREALPLLEAAAAKQHPRACQLLAAYLREHGQGEGDAAKASEYAARAATLKASPTRKHTLVWHARRFVQKWKAWARPFLGGRAAG